MRDVAETATFFETFTSFVANVADHAIRLDVAETWGCEYRFTDRVLTGDPRVQ